MPTIMTKIRFCDLLFCGDILIPEYTTIFTYLLVLSLFDLLRPSDAYLRW